MYHHYHTLDVCNVIFSSQFFIIYLYKRSLKKSPNNETHFKSFFCWRSHYQKSGKKWSTLYLKRSVRKPIMKSSRYIMRSNISSDYTQNILLNHKITPCFVYLYTYMLLRSIGWGNKENGNLLLSAPLP